LALFLIKIVIIRVPLDVYFDVGDVLLGHYQKGADIVDFLQTEFLPIRFGRVEHFAVEIAQFSHEQVN
jgi:hypothetical protein